MDVVNKLEEFLDSLTVLQYEKLGIAGCIPIYRCRALLLGTNFGKPLQPQFFILHVVPS